VLHLPPPEIVIVDSLILATANAAFSDQNNTIYISKYFLENNDSQRIAATLIEEIGHAIDFQINTQDSAGDEGEIFSALVRGETLTPTQLARLKTENDRAIITVGGQSIEVEKQDFTGNSANNILNRTSVATSHIIVDDITVGESDAYADFLVRLDAPNTGVVTVNYTTGNSTAANGGDYVGQSGFLTFNPGETVKTVRVSLISDTTVEPNETFNFYLTSPSANASCHLAIGMTFICDYLRPSETT
jgi:hypothetical protein